MKSTSPSGEGEGEEREERSAGFILFNRSRGHRLYLLLRHRKGGHWAFPKGRIEPEEDEASAARRELREETGIERLRPIPGFREASGYRFVREGRTISKRVVYFLAEAARTRVRLSGEHSDAAWLAPGLAKRRLTYAESRQLLDKAEATLHALYAQGGEHERRDRT